MRWIFDELSKNLNGYGVERFEMKKETIREIGFFFGGIFVAKVVDLAKDFVNERKEKDSKEGTGDGVCGHFECPKVVDPEVLGSLYSYEFKEFNYYKNGVIEDCETREIVEDPGYFLGNVVEESGFDKDERSEISVVNDRISCAIDLHKMPKEYVPDDI